MLRQLTAAHCPLPRRVVVLAAVTACLALGLTAQAQATTRPVCDPSGPFGGACYATIQGAVNSADPGDDVVVLEPGTYAESVEVNKTLNIFGYQEGVDARSGRLLADESTVNPPAGDDDPAFRVTANNVRIDGFTIQGATGDQGALYTGPDNGPYTIVNNIIGDNQFGIYLNSNDAGTTLVQHNLLVNNNVDDGQAASGNAIYSDQGAHMVEIDENRFTGHTEGAITFAKAVVFGPSDQTDIKVTDNVLDNDAGIYFVETQGTNYVLRNRSTSSAFDALVLAGSNQNFLIQHNVLEGAEDGLSNGIKLEPLDFFGVPNSDIEIKNNTLRRNDYGVLLEDGSWSSSDPTLINWNRIERNDDGVRNDQSDTLNAENNYWGCKTGPNTGRCDTTVGAVDFNPWRTKPNGTGP